MNCTNKRVGKTIDELSIFTPLDCGRGVAGVIVDGDCFCGSSGNHYVGIGWLVGDVWSIWRIRERREEQE